MIDRHSKRLLLITGLLLVAVAGWPAIGSAQPAATATVSLVRVPLPLTDERVVGRVREAIERVLGESPDAQARPTVVLEFAPQSGEAGEGTRFESALALARYLASERLSRVRVVAYLPSSVKAHAVLPVLACEQIIMAPSAELGAAADKDGTEAIVQRVYAEMARRRRTVPEPLVMGMLDPQVEVSRVELTDGKTQFALGDELAALRAEGKIAKVTTIKPAGEVGLFSGQRLRQELGIVSHLAADRLELARALSVPPTAIQVESSSGNGRGLLIDVHRLNAAEVNRVQRSISDARSASDFGVLCLAIDSPGGTAEDAMQLANYLASPELRNVRTVAFVPQQARSTAALVALACDELVVSETARLGGPGDVNLNRHQLDDLRTAVKTLAQERGRDWSPMIALVDSELPVFAWTREGTGEVRYFSLEEQRSQANPAEWRQGAQLDTAQGISGRQALDWGLARESAESTDEIATRFNLVDSWERAEPNVILAAMERLALQPWFAHAMLFIAFFALMAEASTPGVGVPGFVSAIAFLLFFWSQFLSGTAGWLEVLLFLGGGLCLVVEIFVLPGFGIFGIGGGLMIVASIVLAAQTFIIPRNSYQLDQVPGSLLRVVVGFSGGLAALWIMRRYLSDTPVLRRIMLPPPNPDEALQRATRESLVNWSALVGKRGLTTTQLTPSGKARFGDDVMDVISDGELIPRGTAVTVVEVRGNRVLVQPIEEQL